jgi:hypothetical protein
MTRMTRLMSAGPGWFGLRRIVKLVRSIPLAQLFRFASERFGLEFAILACELGNFLF